MRSLWRVSSLCFLLAAVAAWGQEQKRTDTEIDGFAGPVQSVATSTTMSGAKWRQPGGPTVLIPIWCHDCEYDSYGSRIRSGQVMDGKFLGEEIQIVRDANGRPTERTVTDVATRQIITHDAMGPFGRTDEIDYLNGKVSSHQTFAYDTYGHMTEWLSLDATGAQLSRVVKSSYKDGTLREETVWDKDGKLSRKDTYDEETKVERFTTYGPSGDVKLTWTMADGRLESFWEPPDSPSQFGDNFTEDAGHDTRENYACGNDGRCEISRVHYEYLDGDKRNPLGAEWRDSEGNLLYAAYYEYETDSFHNWTARKIWVLTPELPERTLYEADVRAITYWQK
jgi:hypothetical protein